MKHSIFIAAIVSFMSVTTLRAADYVWWEGEDPVATNFPDRSWFSPRGDEARLLSGGAWLSADAKRQGPPLFARYSVDITTDGPYQFWCRKFWKHGPFRWRFDSGGWTRCGADVALADWVEIRPKLCANWVFLGEVSLTAGKHDFEFELLADRGESITSAFDAFILTRDPFVPNGRFKPDQRTNRAVDGWFAYEPDLTDFESGRMLIDLRSLNEDIAGQHGHVQRDSDRLRLGDGREVRFWGVNVTDENAAQARSSVDYLARRLASLGVNLVRYHAPLFERGRGGAEVDAKKLDNLHYLIAVLKREGIYTALSTYFPLWIGQDGEHPFGQVFFPGDFQNQYRGWLQQTLEPINPYTGISIADDPAIAMIELVNEDSLLFYTFSPKRIPAASWRDIERQFEVWADDTDAELLDIWYLTREGRRQGNRDLQRRAARQLRFLVETQRDFYLQTQAWLRDDPGYPGLVIASNWKTADPQYFDALERYTYAAGDIIDRHAYLGADHEGPGASYELRTGQTYRDRPVIRDPATFPVQADQVADYPQMISELGWSNPNRYRAGAAPLAAAYASLQGIDALGWFAVSSNLLRDSRAEKFPIGSPVMAGAFPAAALIYRRGDIAIAPPALTTAVSTRSLLRFSGAPAPAAGAGNFDKLRAPEAADSLNRPANDTAAAFTQGPVIHHFSDTALDTTAADHAPQLDWNDQRGLVHVNTPTSRGAIGFLADAGTIRLGDITITSRNEYSSVLIVALDGLPLHRSAAILIQAITEEKPFGFQSTPAADGRQRITSTGTPPLNVREIDTTVTLPGTPESLYITALDFNGIAATDTDHRVTKGDHGRTTIRLPSRHLYTLVERRPATVE